MAPGTWPKNDLTLFPENDLTLFFAATGRSYKARAISSFMISLLPA
jgi:hypothetical protein